MKYTVIYISTHFLLTNDLNLHSKHVLLMCLMYYVLHMLSAILRQTK